jgi:hypothetical protein
MKPEGRLEGRIEGSSEVIGTLSDASQTEGDIELTDDEEVILNLLNDHSPINLNELKDQSGLSNKKWDKAIKGLTKNKLAKVEKAEEGLLVSVV